MHEASITQSVIDTVLDTVRQECGLCRVTSVHVTVGVCQGIVPESMKMFFDMQKPGTLCENAELVITIQKMEAHCPSCDRDRELDIPILYCSECGTPMTLKKGDEILVTTIEVDED